MTRARKALLASLTASIAAAVGMTGLGISHADPQPRAAAPAAAEMPYAVEDYIHPGADRIQQEQQILLKRGDGNIMLVACEGTTDIMVKSRVGAKEFCFDVKAKKGYLTLELADAFGIWTEAYAVKATITPADGAGKKTVIDAPANGYKPFGEGVEGGERSILLELRVG
ncbi:hypothetical protein [Streptomyces sp. NPDC020965]|uniref:hypothetical protein n=1 Tax=Streptomyces sp. NPDC020965 TaxID=3365105 RepID=UPI0037B0E0FD